jgi:hypothetical protein
MNFIIALCVISIIVNLYVITVIVLLHWFYHRLDNK